MGKQPENIVQARFIEAETWVAKDSAVLCFVRNPIAGKVLLIHKKTGLGAGLINAPGGKIEKGETPVEAAQRETLEEVQISVSDLTHVGDLYFQFVDGYSIQAYVFQTETWLGIPQATKEADPFWCDEKEIPYENMWADDSWWLPHLLAGRPFRGRFIFNGALMLSMSLDIESNNPRIGIPSLHHGGKYE